MIISSPKYPDQHGKGSEALVSLLDLVPTLSHLVADDSYQKPDGLDGESLIDVLSGKRNQIEGRNHVFSDVIRCEYNDRTKGNDLKFFPTKCTLASNVKSMKGDLIVGQAHTWINGSRTIQWTTFPTYNAVDKKKLFAYEFYSDVSLRRQHNDGWCHELLPRQWGTEKPIAPDETCDTYSLPSIP